MSTLKRLTRTFPELTGKFTFVILLRRMRIAFLRRRYKYYMCGVIWICCLKIILR